MSEAQTAVIDQIMHENSEPERTDHHNHDEDTSASMASRSYSDLPIELLEIIIKSIKQQTTYFLDQESFPQYCCDLLQCRQVSRSWRYVVDALFSNELPSSCKQLSREQDNLLIYSPAGETISNYCWFYSAGLFKDAKIPPPKSTLALISSYDVKVVYSCRGWLLVIGTAKDGSTPAIPYLFNPLSGLKIELPIIIMQELCSWDHVKFTVSSTNPLVVVALFEKNKLSFWRHGDEQWIPIDTKNNVLDDIIYYKGEFYGISQNITLVHVDLRSPPDHDHDHDHYPCTNDILILQREHSVLLNSLGQRITNVVSWRYCLAESCEGDLLLIVRGMGCNIFRKSCQTIGFRIMKMDWKLVEWVNLTRLDGEGICLGRYNGAMCVKYICKNRIYYNFGLDDQGVYEYENLCKMTFPGYSFPFVFLTNNQLWLRPTIYYPS